MPAFMPLRQLEARETLFCNFGHCARRWVAPVPMQRGLPVLMICGTAGALTGAASSLIPLHGLVACGAVAGHVQYEAGFL